MKIFKSAEVLATELKDIKFSGKNIGLVPTMGNLHSGHLALVERAKQDCDFVLATIFVNPMQFGPDEDFERYPKTLEQDKAQLEEFSCDALFMPSVAEMYPNGLKNQTVISVPELSEMHCGKSRPGHFDGVCTIVSKLFNLTKPDTAFFGTKDFQQLLIIKKMVADLCMPINIVGVPIQRDENGLALSSRNAYLSQTEKDVALNLSAILLQAKEAVLTSGNQDFQAIETSSKSLLSTTGMQVDYFTVCNASTLMPASTSDRHIVILAAAYLGSTRLIDNIEVDLNRI